MFFSQLQLKLVLKSQTRGCSHTGCSHFPWGDETLSQERRKVCSRDIQQVRQSKQQNMVDLDRGVNLRTNEIRLSPTVALCPLQHYICYV